MSRVYEALQKSQGENPSASPLVSDQPEAAATPSEATAVAVAAGVPVGEPTEANWLNVPADRILHPRPTPEQRLVALAEPNSAGAEMFRVLSTRLAHMQNKRRLQKLLITSSVGDEGKSVVAVNLALTLARRPNVRTLLIEADLRRPSASKLLTSSSLLGISDWNAGKLALEDSLYQVNDLPLWFLSAGRGMSEPLPLLESDRFAKMLETVSSSFDWVLLDATPMLPMADSTSLSRLCDGVLVVVREGHTHRKVLNKALESIEKSKLLGMVFNEASMSNAVYEHYYGGNNSSGKSKKEPKKEADKVPAATA
jgi:capsular exopolysaccharide synthesis family protein